MTFINDQVIRGGSWYYPASQARSAARRHYEPTVRTSDIGVRPMRAVTRD